VTVRLACFDAPETAQAPYGAKARATLQALAPVESTVAIQGSKKDRYGRTIAEVLKGRTNVNLEPVRRGDAFVYRQYLRWTGFSGQALSRGVGWGAHLTNLIIDKKSFRQFLFSKEIKTYLATVLNALYFTLPIL